MGKRQVNEAVERLEASGLFRLQSTSSIRTDCIFCGGVKTLSITNTGREYIWFCFRARCNSSGKKSLENIGVTALRNSLKQGGYALLPNAYMGRSIPFVVPGSFVPATNIERAIQYIRQNHCLRAMVEERVEILYDENKERTVFLLQIGGVIYDAVGRSLDRHISPKWLRYGSSDLGFHVPALAGSKSKTCILVEDCASACAASSLMDTFAILGTSIHSAYIQQLRGYETLILALDPDALRKSINLHRKLSWYFPTKVWNIPDDLKYYNSRELVELALAARIIREEDIKASS